jgi:cytochrome bd-type quinol oxidase subunit 1
MFSTNQWIFVACFLVAFVILMIFSYKKDKNLHKKHYKGTLWILVGFLVFVMLLLAVKTLLKD